MSETPTELIAIQMPYQELQLLAFRSYLTLLKTRHLISFTTKEAAARNAAEVRLVRVRLALGQSRFQAMLNRIIGAVKVMRDEARSNEKTRRKLRAELAAATEMYLPTD